MSVAKQNFATEPGGFGKDKLILADGLQLVNLFS